MRHLHLNVFAAVALAVTTMSAASPAGRPAAASSPDLARMTAIAQARYDIEAGGTVVHGQLARVAADPALVSALGAGDLSALRAEATRLQGQLNEHISCLQVFDPAGRVLADVGVPFCVAGPRIALRSADGRPLGSLVISIQDEIGFVRYMHKVYGVDVYVRGASGTARTSLPAARHVRLPGSGTVTIAGRRYAVATFARRALNDEPVTVWILVRT